MTSPFDNNHATPWTPQFVDLNALNAHASDGIASAVQRVRESARAERQGIESASLLVLGPAGEEGWRAWRGGGGRAWARRAPLHAAAAQARAARRLACTFARSSARR